MGAFYDRSRQNTRARERETLRHRDALRESASLAGRSIALFVRGGGAKTRRDGDGGFICASFLRETRDREDPSSGARVLRASCFMRERRVKSKHGPSVGPLYDPPFMCTEGHSAANKEPAGAFTLPARIEAFCLISSRNARAAPGRVSRLCRRRRPLHL